MIEVVVSFSPYWFGLWYDLIELCELTFGLMIKEVDDRVKISGNWVVI